jgi:anti-sigma factor RsiW
MTIHIDRSVDHYVLELLPPGRRQSVEQHMARCPRCQKLVQIELERTERLTIALRRATRAPSGRLDALWPGVAAAVQLSAPRSRLNGWFQWKAALVACVIASLLFAGVLGTVRRFDGWLMSTDTPTAAAITVAPTASLTPTSPQPSPTPGWLTVAAVAHYSAAWGTPEPVSISSLPQRHPAASP